MLIDLNNLGTLTKSELLDLASTLSELDRRERMRKIDTFYPDTGPLRRELYPKHLEFFKVGREYKERCIIAANRIGKCVTGNTLIDTPDGKRSVEELYREGRPFRVYAWDGEKVVETEALPPFAKGYEECVRICCGDEWVETSLGHRVLTDRGFQKISSVLPKAFGAFGFSHEGTSLGLSRSVQTSGGRRLTGKARGCLDGCFVHSRQGGGQPHGSSGNGQVFLPLRVDVPLPSSVWYSLDVLVRRCTNSFRSVVGHPSTLDALRLSVARFSASLSRILCNAFQPYRETLQRFLPLSTAEFCQLQSSFLGSDGLASDISLRPPKGCGHSITYKPIGRNRVFDFEVPHYHNYIAGGLVHHNSEGIGAYEVTLHLTGQYPEWWEGKRFDHPVLAWAAGDTGKTVRDIIQLKLLGPNGAFGTGMIPGELIEGTTPKHGLPDAIESVKVRHISDGISTCFLKSYDQRREAFQGTEIDVFWCDEEPPEDIYVEGLMRTMTTGGVVLVTFTPLMGVSNVVQSFMPGVGHRQ